MNNFKTRNVVLYASIALLLVSIAFKASYAFLNAKVIGNDDVAESKIVVGKLDIDFVTNEYIKPENGRVELIDDADRATKALKSTFNVTNKQSSTLNGRYNIFLTDLTISDVLKQGDLKWELLSVDTNGTKTTLTGVKTFENATSGTDYQLNTTVREISQNATDRYELRVWVSKTNDDQTDLLTGTFSAKVKVVATVARSE